MIKMAPTHIRKKFLSTAFAALLFVGAGVFLFAGDASAQLSDIVGGLLPKCNWAGDPSRGILAETYGLGAFVELAVNILKLIWGILGSLAIVMFVWGGFLWLTARGEENQIKQGWDTLINAVIGVLIVLGSWVIINTIILALTNPGSWNVAKVFSGAAEKEWTQLVAGDVCIKVAERKKGFVDIPEGVSASGASNVTDPNRIFSYKLCSELPNGQKAGEPREGEDCTAVCTKLARQKRTGVAVDNAVNIKEGPDKGCCCSLSMRAIGEGCGTRTEGEGTRGCAPDQYCDSKKQECLAKKEDGAPCASKEECKTDICPPATMKCGTPAIDQEGICCFNIIKYMGPIITNWQTKYLTTKYTECHASSEAISSIRPRGTELKYVRFCSGAIDKNVCGTEKEVGFPSSGKRWQELPELGLKSNYPNVTCQSR